MSRLQRAGSATLVAVGHAAIGVSGGLATGALVTWALGGVGARPPPWLRAGLVAGAAAGLAVSVALDGGGAWPVVHASLLVLALHRRLFGEGPDDERVSAVLAGLMLVAAAGVEAPGFGALAAVFAVALPAALARDGAPPLAFWVAHLGTSAGLFLLLPRFAELPGDPERRHTGFAPDVSLDAIAPLLDDPTVVFRASMDPAPAEPVYWRGLALDGFDGERWFSTTPPSPVRLDAGRGEHLVRVTPMGAGEGVLFVPGRPVRVDGPRGLRADRQGGFSLADASAEPYVFEVVPPLGPGPWFTEPVGDRSRWTQLPALPPAVHALAADVAGVGSDAERIERLAAWLRAEVRYTRGGVDHGAQPLVDFLLHRREGHCGYVAAGLAVMARSVGVPARVVNGFVGGDVNPLTQEWVVRRRHAHSWNEVLIGDTWVLVDATPSAARAEGGAAPTAVAWRDFDRDRQAALVWQVGGMVEGALRLRPDGLPWRGLLVVAGFGLLVVGVARRLVQRWVRVERSVPRGAVAEQHRRARAAVARHTAIDPSLPPVTAAESLRGRVPAEAADAMLALAWLYYDAALDGQPGGAAQARALADRVERALGGVTDGR